jgi:hypothetical protein
MALYRHARYLPAVDELNAAPVGSDIERTPGFKE